MSNIRPEIRLMFQKDLISLSQEVQRLRANLMRLTWNFTCSRTVNSSPEEAENLSEIDWWGNAAHVHCEELESDLRELAKLADPNKPSNL